MEEEIHRIKSKIMNHKGLLESFLIIKKIE